MFKNPIIHSSELDSDAISEETIKGVSRLFCLLLFTAFPGKKVVVIGSGASGVEAVETALQRGAGEVVMVARTDKVRCPVWRGLN